MNQELILQLIASCIVVTCFILWCMDYIHYGRRNFIKCYKDYFSSAFISIFLGAGIATVLIGIMWGMQIFIQCAVNLANNFINFLV